MITPKNTDELDYQPPLKCGDISCICHNQHQEREKDFDERFCYKNIDDEMVIRYVFCQNPAELREELLFYIQKNYISRSEVAGIVEIIKSRLPNPMTEEEMEKYHWEGSILFWGEKILEEILTRLKKLGIEI